MCVCVYTYSFSKHSHKFRELVCEQSQHGSEGAETSCEEDEEGQLLLRVDRHLVKHCFHAGRTHRNTILVQSTTFTSLTPQHNLHWGLICLFSKSTVTLSCGRHPPASSRIASVLSTRCFMTKLPNAAYFKFQRSSLSVLRFNFIQDVAALTLKMKCSYIKCAHVVTNP